VAEDDATMATNDDMRERLERDLGELNTKMDTRFSDHGTLLKDHDRRITALEGR